jgi:glutamate synthase (NADPH) small chain
MNDSRTAGRVEMPKQPVAERIRNFSEVALGYSEEEARREAARCIQCRKPLCVQGCPVDIEIPKFILEIRNGDDAAAAATLKARNSLPAVCGRVCPQEEQCEKLCILGKKGSPVAIGRLERYAADREAVASRSGDAGRSGPTAADARVSPKAAVPASGRRVAVIGAGPAGLTAAGELAKSGHRVTLFEALHKPGGVLVYGIPEFRLPKAVVEQECDYIRSLGVEIRCSYVAGRSGTVDELLRTGFDAVFIGTGAGLPYFMNIPGENLNGVYSSNEFLTRVNLMKAYRFPEYDTPVHIGRSAAVIGGGNVAMDAARCALRLGAETVHLVYRRGREQLPAREEEIENAFEEGVRPVFLTVPIEILGDKNGWVKGLECIRMELGEPDESGRRKPVPVAASNHVLEADTVIMAIGQGPNPLLTLTTPGLELNKWGYIVADENTGATSKKGVFAGGDIVSGAATVILAMGAGKKAAMSINLYLKDLK